MKHMNCVTILAVYTLLALLRVVPSPERIIAHWGQAAGVQSAPMVGTIAGQNYNMLAGLLR
jgi:hypothetical protein